MPDLEPFERLATLAAQLGQRRRQVDEFRRKVEPLLLGGLEAVDGEGAVLGDLDTKLSTAFELVAAIPGGNPDALIDQLEALLNDVDWELLAELQPDLNVKYQHQTELLTRVTLDLKTWEGTVTEIAKFLEGARFEGARFLTLEEDLRAAQRALANMRTALAERAYGGLPTLQAAGDKLVRQLQTNIEKSEKQVDRVKKLVKQADLLIMQVGVADGDFEYRVLLRSADRIQTRGINIIQDVRRLTKKDRDWMVERLSTITKNMNQDIRAAHVAAHPEPAGELRTIVPADTTVEDTSQTTKETLGMLGRFMFSLVIPEQMQRILTDQEWSFSITTNDLELPWELLCLDPADGDSPTDARFLCLERSISRMPLGEVFPRKLPRRPPEPQRKRRMLLIHSDPEKNLPAAAAEVNAIQDALKDQLEFERIDPDDATNERINRVLMGKSFDFLHFAGHARFDGKNPELSGLQLKDSVLTAEKIRRLNKGGSLVFLNACESGTVARDDVAQQVSYLLRNPEPVVGLASAFVYSGALGCVGSLWPVYDKPARDLAVQFYRHVLDGEPTGEALRQARMEVREAYPREITWASYVLYGDPTFRLTES